MFSFHKICLKERSLHSQDYESLLGRRKLEKSCGCATICDLTFLQPQLLSDLPLQGPGLRAQ